MKVFGISVLLVMVGAALMFLAFTSTTTSIFSDAIFVAHRDIGTMAASRKLQDNNYNTQAEKMKRDVGSVDLEDYHPIDPAPGSGDLIAGPIERGIPFMPNPRPPSPPSSTRSP